MLQEEQTVAFDPRYIDRYTPLYTRLFYLYLGLVLLLMFARAVRLVWILRSQGIAIRVSKSHLNTHLQDFWDHLYSKSRSLKTLSHLTFLITILALLWSLADDLAQVAMQKTVGIGAVAGGLAETLRTFSVGIVVSTVLFCIAVLCDRLIGHRKLGAAKAQTSG